MILVESDEYLFNFSNAHVIIFENQEISVYYNSNNIMKIQGYETVDTGDFDQYFFKYESEEKKMYFNRFSFLYLKQLEDNFIEFNFFDNFSIEVRVDYQQLLSQA
jgi:hypothetical protein